MLKRQQPAINPGINWLVLVLRLYAVQIAAVAAITLGAYYGLDLLLSLLYFGLVAGEIRHAHIASYKEAVLSFLLWQGIPLFFSFLILADLDWFELRSNAIFILQFWHIPVYSCSALLPFTLGEDQHPLSYYAVLYWPWFSFILYGALLWIKSPAFCSFKSKV